VLPYTDPPAIEHAVEGVRKACASLPVSDRVEIILFSERADVVFSGSPRDIGLPDVLGAVTRRSSVKPLGEGTRFATGLSSALRRMGGVSPECHPRVVLVSDGQAQDSDETIGAVERIGAQGFSLVCLGVGDADSAMLMGEMVSVVGGGHYRHVHGGEALAAALSTQFVSRQDVAFDRVELIVHYTHEIGMDSVYRLDCGQAGGVAVIPCVADEAEPTFARYRFGPIGGPVAHRFVVPVVPFAPGGGRVPIMALGYAGSEREPRDAVRTEVPVDAGRGAEPGPTERRLVAWTVAHNCQARGKRAAMEGEWSAAQEAYALAARTYRTLGATNLAEEAERQAAEAKNHSWDPVRANTVTRDTLWVADERNGR
jgi:hypothetical protein